MLRLSQRVRVETSLCNISRQELPVEMDFTRRFARRDENCTDSGSGLSLSIAGSFTDACRWNAGHEDSGGSVRCLCLLLSRRRSNKEVSQQEYFGGRFLAKRTFQQKERHSLMTMPFFLLFYRIVDFSLWRVI